MKIRITGTKEEVEEFGSKLEAAASDSKDFTIEKWTGTMPASLKDKTFVRYYQVKIINKK